MKKLAIINYQAIKLYHSQGWSKERLSTYYNPENIFDEVCIYAFQEPGISISDKNGWHISDHIYVHPFHEFNTVFEQIKTFQPQVIRCYECNLPFALFTLKAAQKFDIPSYLSLHDSRKYPDFCLKDYTVITAYNDQVAKNAMLILNRPIEIQLNGIDSQFFSLQPDPKIGLYHTHRIFTIGRDDPVKNMDTMITATAMFNSQTKESVKHVLAGPGTQKMVVDSLIHDGYGSATEIKIRDYLQWANCFFQVQLVPDIGMAHTEALMMGIPIITTAQIPKFIGIQIPLDNARNTSKLANALHSFFSYNYNSKHIRQWAIEQYDNKNLQKKEAERYRRFL